MTKKSPKNQPCSILVANCTDPNVFDNCPKLCGTCIPCDKIDGQFGEWKTVVACQQGCTEGDLEVKLRE